MDSLPPELQDLILRELDLDDLARCRRVSRGLRESVHRVLSIITSVHRKKAFLNLHHLYGHFSLALRSSAPQYTVSQAEFRRHKTTSFLRFVDKFCANVSSLVATDLSVDLEDITALAQRLKMFLLYRMTSSGFLIDANTLVTNFPNLQFYFLEVERMCSHKVMREFALIPSSQFAMYRECYIEHTCRKAVNVRSIELLQFLSTESLLNLCELRPSSLSSLKYLHLECVTLSSQYLPSLPNLLDASLKCGHSLNNVIRCLHSSSKLSTVHLEGKVIDQSVSAVQILLSKCRALRRFTLQNSFYEENDIDDGDEHSLDLSQARSLREFQWYDIDFPVEVILPSHCQSIRIVSNCDLDLPAEETMNHVMHLCPLVRCLIIRPYSVSTTAYPLYVFDKMLAEIDVSDIILIAEGENKNLDEPRLAKFLSLINKHPQSSFSFTIHGLLKTPLEQLIHPVVTRPFTINDECNVGVHVVKFPAT